MFTRQLSSILTASVVIAITAATAGAASGESLPAAAAAGQSAPGANAGPPYKFTTEIMHGDVIPLKNQAMINKTDHGYVFRGGQQDNHLVVTVVRGGLRFVDSGTKSWRRLSPSCHAQKVNPGVAAVCRLSDIATTRKPVLLEVWPRLGNDFLDTSTLPATFAATMLGDKGNDTARFGAGADFFNGFSGRDVVSGGGGNDWIRSGLGSDSVEGGSGNDDIVAVEGNDSVRGGNGTDRLWAGDGRDRLSGGTGNDFFLCGSGHDNAKAGPGDSVSNDCESVDRS